ncbi:neural/ectodermal development factor IMP-L2 isoform X2 [Agrilus planipennis]|uniref:Neural/ectodermal development factor IMP-L2 isoform X2 n=1 Tax=Agrilus planipennis TaxID=224129 RepID=A0A1W4WLK6_AGRPL|nr:neural/ectodermal development factor IMP-L2 isoform X2 [Agrilus planipennis]
MGLTNTTNLVYYAFLLATCIALFDVAICRRLSEDIGNSENEIGDETSNEVGVAVPLPRTNSFVKIIKAPYGILNKKGGERIELECEAIGSPPPLMQWLMGNKVLTENEAFETNLINSISSQGRALTKTRLIINKALSVHEGVFTCVAEAGEKVASATITLRIVKTPDQHKNFSRLLTESILGQRTQPRIVYFYTTLLDFMGNDIALPCKVNGSPQPEVFWTDANKNVISRDTKSRVSVLPDGELRIRSLRWEDMGPYTCVAQNSEGDDSITTFLYPMALGK